MPRAVYRLVPKKKKKVKMHKQRELTYAGRSRDVDRGARAGRDGGAAAAGHDDGDAEAAADLACASQVVGAGGVVGAALADGGRAEARVGEVGGDVGEGKVHVGHVRHDRRGRGGRHEVVGCGAGADGAADTFGRERGGPFCQ